MHPRRHDPDWAFGVAGGIVRAVYGIDGWELGADGRRWGFVGSRDGAMASRYEGVHASALFRRGNSNPVTYVNCRARASGACGAAVQPILKPRTP